MAETLSKKPTPQEIAESVLQGKNTQATRETASPAVIQQLETALKYPLTDVARSRMVSWLESASAVLDGMEQQYRQTDKKKWLEVISDAKSSINRILFVIIDQQKKALEIARIQPATAEKISLSTEYPTGEAPKPSLRRAVEIVNASRDAHGRAPEKYFDYVRIYQIVGLGIGNRVRNILLSIPHIRQRLDELVEKIQKEGRGSDEKKIGNESASLTPEPDSNIAVNVNNKIPEDPPVDDKDAVHVNPSNESIPKELLNAPDFIQKYKQVFLFFGLSTDKKYDTDFVHTSYIERSFSAVVNKSREVLQQKGAIDVVQIAAAIAKYMRSDTDKKTKSYILSQFEKLLEKVKTNE